MIFFILFFGWLEASWGRDLSTTEAWLNLLHYQNKITGFKSEADGSGFFLATDGKTHPQHELLATIEALKDSQKLYGKIKAPAACVYPARKKFLENAGYTFPKVSCPDYENWRKGLPVTSVSLVFASAYPNNPASMFGHTFLRLNGPGEGNSLLDYVVNFAATTGEAGGIEFALLGVFGGYEGHYSLAPYFIKVNEYNHGEARDLWEYPLSLKSEEIDMLLAHLWEMEASSYFDYYFFDENCSWQILRLIEAAAPKLDLTSHAPFYIIPADTVKTLKKKNLLGEPIFRPSLRRQYIARGNPKSEKEKLEKKLLYYRIKDRRGKLSPKQKEEYHESLKLRATDTSPMTVQETPKGQNRPDLGHGLRRVSLSQGDSYRRLSFKFAQHDLLDQDLGHEPWSALDVVRITGEEKDGEIFLSDAALVDVTSLHAWDGLGYEPSWFLKVGAEAPQEFVCQKCLTGVFRGGLGQTLKFFQEQFFTSIFFSTKAYGFNTYESGPFLGYGLRALLGYRIQMWKFTLDVEKLWTQDPDYHLLTELMTSYQLNENFALRGRVLNFSGKFFSKSDLSILYYF